MDRWMDRWKSVRDEISKLNREINGYDSAYLDLGRLYLPKSVRERRLAFRRCARRWIAKRNPKEHESLTLLLLPT